MGGQARCASSAGFTAGSSMVTLLGVGVHRPRRATDAFAMAERQVEHRGHTEWHQSGLEHVFPWNGLAKVPVTLSLRNGHLDDHHGPVCRQASRRSRTFGGRVGMDAEGLEMAWWSLRLHGLLQRSELSLPQRGIASATGSG